jgi:hypothetical protein
VVCFACDVLQLFADAAASAGVYTNERQEWLLQRPTQGLASRPTAASALAAALRVSGSSSLAAAVVVAAHTATLMQLQQHRQQLHVICL